MKRDICTPTDFYRRSGGAWWVSAAIQASLLLTLATSPGCGNDEDAPTLPTLRALAPVAMISALPPASDSGRILAVGELNWEVIGVLQNPTKSSRAVLVTVTASHKLEQAQRLTVLPRLVDRAGGIHEAMPVLDAPPTMRRDLFADPPLSKGELRKLTLRFVLSAEHEPAALELPGFSLLDGTRRLVVPEF